MKLPDDYAQHLPNFVYNWLDKYIDRHEVQRHRFGFSEKRMSLVMPATIGGEVVMYQTRYFGDDPKEPKYRTYGYKNDVIYIPDEHHAGPTVCIVEDLISAIKICRVCNAMPLFGSSLSQEQMYRLSKSFRRARIWLDPNMKEKSVRTALMLSQIGLPTTTIFSAHDPKDFPTVDIRQYVDPLGEI